MMRAVRATTKLIALSLLVQLAFAGPAAAIPPMYSGPIIPVAPARVSLGAGVALRHIDDASWAALPLELTLTAVPFTASCGAVFADAGLRHAYFEMGVYLGLSFAAGVGYGSYRTPQGTKEGGTTHLFFGLPIPLSTPAGMFDAGEWFPYVEPYYRPSWGPWPGAAHEVGLTAKITFGFGRAPRPKAR